METHRSTSSSITEPLGPPLKAVASLLRSPSQQKCLQGGVLLCYVGVCHSRAVGEEVGDVDRWGCVEDLRVGRMSLIWTNENRTAASNPTSPSMLSGVVCISFIIIIILIFIYLSFFWVSHIGPGPQGFGTISAVFPGHLQGTGSEEKELELKPTST